MAELRTDLTLEAAEKLAVGGKNLQQLEGVRVIEERHSGYAVTSVTVENEHGCRALGKPKGRYITVDLRPYFQRQENFFSRGVFCIAKQLQQLLPPLENGCVLAAGLGNRAMVCDAVGPFALENLLVTRHMVAEAPQQFADFAPVAALATGVVGQTGIETLELIAGTVQRIRPAAVIVIDALCACSRHRLCATVQLSDAGLAPGSGVGNHRSAINAETLGVPVVAIGVPTVMAGAVLAHELTGHDAVSDRGLFVTPRDVDSRVRELSRLVGYGMTAALQPNLTVEDIAGLLG